MRSWLLLVLFLPACATHQPDECFAPVNLNFSESLVSYDFTISGQTHDGSDYAKSIDYCPGTFAGGSCDEQGITLNDFDNLGAALNLSVIVADQAVFDGEVVVDEISDQSCDNGDTREVDVALSTN